MKPETLKKIQDEQLRRAGLFGGVTLPGITSERFLAVLTEEIGEVARAVLDLERPPTLHPNAARRRREHLELEIIHVAAVAAAWLDERFSDPPEESEERSAA